VGCGLPIAFYFAGLGEPAEHVIMERYQDWASVAPEPFILVAASRQPGRWWFIDDDTCWGWISGEFRPEVVELVSTWMESLIGRDGVDCSRVGLFGFSAGAYAATELLAKGRLQLSGFAIGGTHGHGQSDLEGVPPKRAEGVVEKFQAFQGRLGEHQGALWMEATHARSDQQCACKDALRIFEVLSARQAELQLPEVQVRIMGPEEHDTPPGSRTNKTHHDYMKATFMRSEFFVALFGGPAPTPKALPEDLPSAAPEAGPAALPPRRQPKPPMAPPPTSLDVKKLSVSSEAPDWEVRAFELFSEHGFVIVEDLLKLHQYTAVHRDCESAAKAMVGNDRRGNRGPGRYSFGVASSSGSMLHVGTWARHLLDGAGGVLRPLLDLIFAAGDAVGPDGGDDASEKLAFSVYAGGGDFVTGDVRSHQKMHSDINISKALNRMLPPPMLSVNFCVQDLTHLNGPTRIVPGTQLEGGLGDGETEPAEWRCSRLCPVPAGAAIVRDVRVLHGGTPNLTPKTRYLPSIEYVSAGLRETKRKDMFPQRRGLPRALYEKLSPEVQELCGEIVADEGEVAQVQFHRK